jgi:uncharacterized membrane protein (UPF0127 family)
VRPFVPLLTPTQPARYLLELPAGLSAKLKIQIGDRLQINE